MRVISPIAITQLLVGATLIVMPSACRSDHKIGAPSGEMSAVTLGASEARAKAVTLSQDEWNYIKERLEKGKVRQETTQLEARPLPGGGMRVLPVVRCPPGCEPLLRADRIAPPPEFRDRFGVPGDGVAYTPHPDTVILPDCWCPPEVDVPDLAGPPASLADCQLVVRFTRRSSPVDVLHPVLTCDDINCTGRCAVVAQRQSDGVYLITCECR